MGVVMGTHYFCKFNGYWVGWLWPIRHKHQVTKLAWKGLGVWQKPTYV